MQLGQRLLGLLRDRLAGHRGRDVRVAVAVAADPRAEAHEGGHGWRVAPRIGAGQGGLDAAVDPRDRTEECVVEDGEDRLHLVARLGLRAAQRRGALEDVDVLEHPTPRDAALGRPVERVVVAVELGRDPAQRAGHRAAAGLGRVRGEDRVDPQLRQAGRDRLRVGLAGQLGDRLTDAAGVDASGELPVLAAQRPGPLALLGQIRQVQMHRHRAGQGGGRLMVEPEHDLVGAGAAGAVAGLAARGDERIHDGDELLPAGLAQDLLVQAGEEGQIRSEPAQGAGRARRGVGRVRGVRGRARKGGFEAWDRHASKSRKVHARASDQLTSRLHDACHLPERVVSNG